MLLFAFFQDFSEEQTSCIAACTSTECQAKCLGSANLTELQQAELQQCFDTCGGDNFCSESCLNTLVSNQSQIGQTSGNERGQKMEEEDDRGRNFEMSESAGVRMVFME